MKLRTALYTAVAAVTVSGLGLSPAAAATPAVPVVSDLDASTPGHVTGTVTSDAPYVYASLGTSWVPQELVPVGGTATFDLETWGLAGPRLVRVIACPTANAGSTGCSTPATGGVGFEPTDVRPEVTWFTDDTVGPGQSASVTVADDPQGGGTLQAVWQFASGQVGTTPLDRNGTTDLLLHDGAGPVQIERCSAVPQQSNTCAPFDPAWTKELHVQQEMAVSAGEIAAITASSPTTTVALDTDVAGSYQLTWHLTLDGQTVAGTGGTAAGSLDGNGGVPTFVVDAAALADGSYHLAGTLTVDDPDFGHYQADVPDAVIEVHQNGPTIISATPSRTTIYPRIDTPAFPRSVTFTFTSPGPIGAGWHVDLRNSDGTTVTQGDDLWPEGNQLRATWDGRDAAGNAMPAGVYTAVVVDPWGNSGAATSRVTLSSQRLVSRTFSTRVSASRSLVDKYVGRCSTLRKPSLRRWKGSLGFYANTKCSRRSWRASAVSTLHVVRLPAAVEYGRVRVSLYGGAAKGHPRSQGVLSYLTAKGDWVGGTVVSRALRSHGGATWRMVGMVQDGRWFAWGFATADKMRYDVRDFTVSVTYYVLG